MKDEEMEKALKAQEMFDKLKTSIGKPIKCKYWKNGEKRENVLTLRDVKDFMGIECVGEYIPFVGQCIAITEISTKDDEVLYVNPYIEEGYNRTTDKEINDARNLSYGNGTWPINNPYSDWIPDPALIESEIDDYPSSRKR